MMACFFREKAQGQLNTQAVDSLSARLRLGMSAKADAHATARMLRVVMHKTQASFCRHDTNSGLVLSVRLGVPAGPAVQPADQPGGR
jgi:hypothetical protein